jgi:TnpA family transposase
LKAFGKIIKSTFILRYIDEVELRKAIERQLNTIEHAHHFTRAVPLGNPREFIPAEKQEQEIAEGCKRLIKIALSAGIISACRKRWLKSMISSAGSSPAGYRQRPGTIMAAYQPAW